MKKITFSSLVFALVFAVSCDSDSASTSQEGNQKDTTQSNMVIVDTMGLLKKIDSIPIVDLTRVQFFMPEEITVLKQFSTDSVIFFMDYHLVNYFEAKQDTILIQNFNNLTQIFSIFAINVIDSPKSQISVDGFLYPDNMKASLSFLQDATPFIIHTCVAECTEYGIDFDLTNMAKQAALTSGKLDDEYFEILAMANELNYSLSNDFKVWFMQMWDYGGGSLLGNKSIYNFLKKVKKFEQKTMKVDPVLEKLKLDAYETAMHGIYMKSAISILEEIKMLVNENLVSPEQASNLNQLASLIKSSAAECSVCFFKELQVNCDNGNCNYGG
jgi:hypothetical protein